jgi:hypothetical protein
MLEACKLSYLSPLRWKSGKDIGYDWVRLEGETKVEVFLAKLLMVVYV